MPRFITCWISTLAAMLACLGMAAVAVPAAHAANHALLVGVNEVAALPPRLWLRGPANDVMLMREALLARGFEAQNITVLAQRVPGTAGAPTWAAIAAAMAALKERAQPGDTVLLHLAGHGAQLPAPDNGEPDGLDEVFLTADVQPWDPATGRLPNALRDHDIGAWIDGLVDRGVQVWAVFDACHAAGMARGSGATQWRSVAAAELGVPAAGTPAIASKNPAQAAPKPVPQPLPSGQRRDGRVLAYAARAHEATGEEWLPRGGGLARTRMHGVFSYEVAQALLGGAGNAAALREWVRRRYAEDGRLTPAPQVLGEGGLGRQ